MRESCRKKNSVSDTTATQREAKRPKSAKKKAGKKDAVQSRNRLLSTFTEDAMRSYFKNLNGHKPADIYKLVMGEVEPPMLRAVMEYSQWNQTLASDILGINRATLRKKLRQYNLHS
jgi:Fis family transcriptional regulator